MTNKIDVLEIVRIAREAGAIILEIYHRSEGIEIDRKADDSPLTIADTQANAHIVAELRRIFPEIPIISEEEKLTEYGERQHWETCWQVDPLDGTKEFIKRNGEFTVNIALIHQGRAVMGVVYAPVPELTAWAAQGEGAWLLEGDGAYADFTAGNIEASRIESTVPGPGEKIRIVASRSHNSPEMEAYLSKFTDPEIRNAGSSLKLLLVARGEAHLYPRLAPTMEWDTSAGQAILVEAGGEVLKVPGEEKLDYNRENLLNPHFMAYAKGMRAAIGEYLKS